jgi:hypothetical protein
VAQITLESRGHRTARACTPPSEIFPHPPKFTEASWWHCLANAINDASVRLTHPLKSTEVSRGQ